MSKEKCIWFALDRDDIEEAIEDAAAAGAPDAEAFYIEGVRRGWRAAWLRRERSLKRESRAGVHRERLQLM
jgi:tRNA(Ser,Leu) C12 N-acetylase TAN1